MDNSGFWFPDSVFWIPAFSAAPSYDPVSVKNLVQLTPIFLFAKNNLAIRVSISAKKFLS